MTGKAIKLSEAGDQLPAVETIQDMLEAAKILLASGFLPDAIKKPEQVVVIMQVAKAMNIPAIHALNSINVIRGKPCMSAELMRALIFRRYPDALFEILERTNKACKIRAARPGGKPQEFEFTMTQAKQIKISDTKVLTDKDSWKNYPEDMLFARTTSRMARALFPEVNLGATYTPEELGAEVNKAGDITALPPEDEIVKAFVGIGVTKEELNNYCQDHFKHTAKDITLDEVGELRAIWNSITYQGKKKEDYFQKEKTETPPGITVKDIEGSAQLTPEEKAALELAEKAAKEDGKPKKEIAKEDGYTEKDYRDHLNLLLCTNTKGYLSGKQYYLIVNGALKLKTDFDAKVRYIQKELRKLNFDIEVLHKECEEWANDSTKR